MKATFKKHKGALYPGDEAAEALLAKVAEDGLVMVEKKQPRFPKHHRLMFGAAKKVVENLPGNMDGYDLIKTFQLITNTHVKIYKTSKGIVTIPDSLSFEHMSQDSFDPFFHAFVDWVAAEVLPGVGKQDLTDEFLEMVA